MPVGSVSRRSFVMLLSVCLSANAQQPASNAQAAAPGISEAKIASHYAALVHANYLDTLAAARSLQQAIDAFVKTPSAQALALARTAWLKAREWYGQTEAFRFYGGPIDDAKRPEGRINAWPMDESFVDGGQERPGTGLINDRKFAIPKKNLAAQNERGGEENIATGWHAIEFLLWGRDQSANGPGNRSFEDFVDGKSANADRRRKYLAVATELLLHDLNTLVKAWAPGVRNNYRAHFEKGGRESVRKMLIGLALLSRGKLAGERLEVALASQDQEDEHSRFSDNTHRDVVANARGIQNVWLGEYQRADGSKLTGASLRELVAARDTSLAKQVSRQIAASVAAAEAIQPPFDREIVGGKDAPGRQRIQKTIDSLTQQSKELVAAAAAIGITRRTLVEPNN